MKKWIALLVALLCLLAGSALAEDVTVNICGKLYTVTTTPQYFLVDSDYQPTTTGANETNYNLKLVLENGVPTITLKDATIKALDAVFSTKSSLVIQGEGTNRLESKGKFCINVSGDCTIASGAKISSISGASFFDLYIGNKLTIDGEIGSIGNESERAITAITVFNNTAEGFILNGSIGSITAKNYGINVMNNGNATISGSIGSLSIKSSDGKGIAAIYAKNDVRITSTGRIGTLEVGTQATKGDTFAGGIVSESIQIDGTIKEIQSETYGLNLKSSRNKITINGTIGEVNAKESGIFSEGGEVCINNSVGPIKVSKDGLSAVIVKKGGSEALVLGDGVSMIKPENGAFLPNAFELHEDGELEKDTEWYAALCDNDVADDDETEKILSREACFVKAPAPFDSSSVPKTGDNTNLALWAMLLMISAIGITVLSRRAKKIH